MASAGNSLRLMVEQWLAADSTTDVRVIEFKNRRSSQQCYVCVEKVKAGGPITVYFFRHKDGTWSIFPPRQERPAFRAF
jgi:hypothetical protein